MAAWRDTKAKAKSVVHATFEVPAVLIPAAGATPLRLLVRDHTKVTLSEANFDFQDSGQVYTVSPKIIVKQSELARVAVGRYVVFAANDIYVTGASTPQREGYIEVDCTRLTADECAALVTAIGSVSGIAAWEGILP